MVKTYIAKYGNYGKCLVMTNGAVEAYFTLDVGPRLIKCNLTGLPNLMKNDDAREMSQDVSSAFGSGKTWYIYGGHRMWMSPENLPLTYYPDNDPIKYSVSGSSAVFSPDIQLVNRQKHEWKVTMSEDKAEFDIEHRLTNVSDHVITGAIWALTVTDAGGCAIVPLSDVDTGLLGSRMTALWPYTRLTDPRVYWGDNYIMLRQDRSVSAKFKVGVNNTRGWLAYFNHGQTLIKSYKPNHPAGRYPDFGASTEIFTNALFLEAETLSELKDIAPGETIVHTEHWRLFKADAPAPYGEAIDRFVKAYDIEG